MFFSDLHPKWWQLYLALPLLILLFFADNRLKLSVRGHQVVQIGILLLVFGLIHLWLKANARALSNMDREHPANKFRVYRIPPAELPRSDSEKCPMIQLPDSEIHGVLDTTFEMDYIDAECVDMDEVPQELNRE